MYKCKKCEYNMDAWKNWGKEFKRPEGITYEDERCEKPEQLEQ